MRKRRAKLAGNPFVESSDGLVPTDKTSAADSEDKLALSWLGS